MTEEIDKCQYPLPCNECAVNWYLYPASVSSYRTGYLLSRCRLHALAIPSDLTRDEAIACVIHLE